MHHAHYACRSHEHSLNRRRFLGSIGTGLGAGSALGGLMTAGLGSLAQGAAADELQAVAQRAADEGIAQIAAGASTVGAAAATDEMQTD